MKTPPDQPALAVVELASLARAAVVVDAIVKRAPVTLERAERVSPGKFLILVTGGVAEVDEGYRAGLQAGAGVVIDHLFLAHAHPDLRAGLHGRYPREDVDSLGLFETYTAAAAVRALDIALKATEVALVGLHLCTGIGGKGYWAVSGPLHLIDEAIGAARAGTDPERLVGYEVIAAPHAEALEAYLAVFRG